MSQAPHDDTPATDPRDGDTPAFTPARPRKRHDGWTAAKQMQFIAALAESGCVTEACRAVGRSPSSAYALRSRTDGIAFANAWDVALEFAIRRLSDAALGRAIHGVATPIFYKGEQIGERRRYDEKLAMFLLRYRDPARYGAWRDRQDTHASPLDDIAIRLSKATDEVAEYAYADAAGDPAPHSTPEFLARTQWLRRRVRPGLHPISPTEMDALHYAEQAEADEIAGMEGTAALEPDMP